MTFVTGPACAPAAVSLPQLEVPDVADTRAAVREMVAQFRRDQDAAAQQQEQQQPQGEGAAGVSTSGRQQQQQQQQQQPQQQQQQQAAGRAGGRPGTQADKGEEAEKGGAAAEPLPGFGPAKSAAAGVGGARGAGSGGGGGGPSGSR